MQNVTEIFFKNKESFLKGRIWCWNHLNASSTPIISVSQTKHQIVLLGNLDTEKIKGILYVNVHNQSIENWHKWFTNEHIFNNYIKFFYSSIQKFINESDYWSSTPEQQETLLLTMFYTIASLHKDGIKHGYLSFYSNIKYYFSQIESMFGEEYLNILSENIESKKRKITSYTEPQADKKLLYELSKIQKWMIDNQENINFSSLPNAKNFFNNGIPDMHYSDFHMYVFNNSALIKRYSQTNFTIYRILMGTFFQLLPTLSVSLNRRYQLIDLLIDNVQHYYHINWKTQISESINAEEVQKNAYYPK